MATRQYNIFQDVTTRLLYTSGGVLLTDCAMPYITFDEQVQITYTAINSKTITDTYEGWQSITVTGAAVIDNNFAHYITGALATAAAAGAVTEIDVTIAAGSYINPTGSLQITNAAALSESVDYTAFTKSGTAYTFTVSATLTNSYAVADVVGVADTPLARATTVDVTDKDDGKLVITIDARSLKYLEQAGTSAQISNCGLEIQVLNTSAEVIFISGFDFLCFNTRDYTGAIPAPADGNYYTKTEVDAMLAGYVSGASGVTAIPSGADSVAITFSVTGALGVTGNVTKPLSADYNITVHPVDDISDTGATVDLSAPTDKAGYKLVWTVVS